MIARSASRSSALVLALLLAVALATFAPPASAQSLWTVRSGSLVTDVRATRAGDLLTILIDEQSSGSKSADTKLSRDGSFTNSLTYAPAADRKWLQTLLDWVKVAGTGKSDYKGSGSTTRTDQASGTLTAKVMRVLDNGTLVVEGRRLVVVHDENLTLVVSGLVRREDVGPDNSVRSSALADGEIRIEGKGTISLRQQPGLFQRVFDWLGLF
jgi:flagellar L-ring protein precursor FlgH